MQTILVFMTLLLGCAGCSTNKEIRLSNKQTKQCDENVAGKSADLAMRKYRYRVETLDRSVTELDSVFLVQYMPKDTIMRGGGGEIKISKETCELLDVKFYQ